MLTAWLAGLVMGVGGSIPVAGPTTMLVLSYGLQGRLRAATMVALGSAVPEGIWAGLALWGFGALLRNYAWVAPASEIAAAVILLAVGLLLLLRPPAARANAEDERTELEGTLRPFMLGLSLTGLNPTLLFNWGAAVTMAVSLGAITPHAKMAAPFGLGVTMGILAWFAFVLQLLARHHRRFSPDMRARILRIMGLILLGLGGLAALRLIVDRV